jgi:hypothetical protein
MLYRIHRIFLDFFNRPVFQKTRRFGNWICFRPQVKVGEKTPTQLGPLERANLNHFYLRTETDPVSETSCFLEYRTMEKVQKNSMNSVLTVQLKTWQLHMCTICLCPTQWICVFRMVLTANSDCFRKQHCYGDGVSFL